MNALTVQQARANPRARRAPILSLEPFAPAAIPLAALG
jgi:hypothetical protein